MNESCSMYERVKSPHMNESCPTYEGVMSHTWMRHVTHMEESCNAYEGVMGHIWKLICVTVWLYSSSCVWHCYCSHVWHYSSHMCDCVTLLVCMCVTLLFCMCVTLRLSHVQHYIALIQCATLLLFVCVKALSFIWWRPSSLLFMYVTFLLIKTLIHMMQACSAFDHICDMIISIIFVTWSYRSVYTLYIHTYI